MSTTILLILLLVGLLYANFVLKPKQPASASLVMMVLALLAFAVMIHFWTGHARERRAQRQAEWTFHSAIGYVIGDAIRERHPGGGDLLAIVPRPMDGRSEAKLEGLKEGLGNAFNIVQQQFRLYTDEGQYLGEGFWMRAEDYNPFFEQHADAVAAVTLIGLPHPMEAQRLMANRPPLYGLDVLESPEVEELLFSGVVEALAVRDRNKDWLASPRRRMSAQEVFAMRYHLVTRENFDEVVNP